MVRHPRDVEVMKARLKMVEHFFAGFLFIAYFIVAHIARVAFAWTGLRVKYINHKPWPYRIMWFGFLNGFDED